MSNISVEHLKYNRGHVVFNLWYYSSKPASRKLCMPKNDLSIGQFNVAHYTNGNVLTIKKMLRHKSVQNTMKYIRALEFRDEDFEMATATTEEEVKQLGQTGFVKYDEMKGTFLQKTQKV